VLSTPCLSAIVCECKNVELTIRRIELPDAEAVSQLSAELGYPVPVAEMEARIRNLAFLPDHAVYVGCQGDTVVGWIDVGIVHHLQAEACGEIGGLVVSHACRNAGVGAQLLLQAEQWVRDRGLKKVIVRSRISRDAAHRFYLREGYERTKTSAVFAKTLDRD
jgi:GNAT superfamily N-acetyltransferase